MVWPYNLVSISSASCCNVIAYSLNHCYVPRWLNVHYRSLGEDTISLIGTTGQHICGPSSFLCPPLLHILLTYHEVIVGTEKNWEIFSLGNNLLPQIGSYLKGNISDLGEYLPLEFRVQRKVVLSMLQIYCYNSWFWCTVCWMVMLTYPQLENSTVDIVA